MLFNIVFMLLYQPLTLLRLILGILIVIIHNMCFKIICGPRKKFKPRLPKNNNYSKLNSLFYFNTYTKNFKKHLFKIILFNHFSSY